MTPDTPPHSNAAKVITRVYSAARAWAAGDAGGWVVVAALALTSAVGLGMVLLNHHAPAVSLPEIEQAGQSNLPDPASNASTAFTLAPSALQDITVEQARAWNDALPYSTDPVLAARPFTASAKDAESYARAVDCLTAAVYYEAGSEPPGGQAAIAQIVLNRTRHPAYPRTVCGVVFQGSERTTGCQFTFTCDGALSRIPSPEGWARARAVATLALNGRVFTPIGTATHYHTDGVAPYWATRLSKVARIGAHIFYRWTGDWGRPFAFTGVYAGTEPVVAAMAALPTPLAIEQAATYPEVSATDGEFPDPIAAPQQIAITPLDRMPLQASETTVATRLPLTAPSDAVVGPQSRDTAIIRDPLPRQPERATGRPRTATPSSW